MSRTGQPGEENNKLIGQPERTLEPPAGNHKPAGGFVLPVRVLWGILQRPNETLTRERRMRKVIRAYRAWRAARERAWREFLECSWKEAA